MHQVLLTLVLQHILHTLLIQPTHRRSKVSALAAAMVRSICKKGFEQSHQLKMAITSFESLRGLPISPFPNILVVSTSARLLPGACCSAESNGSAACFSCF